MIVSADNEVYSLTDRIFGDMCSLNLLTIRVRIFHDVVEDRSHLGNGAMLIDPRTECD
jgi:hypothetical protein